MKKYWIEFRPGERIISDEDWRPGEEYVPGEEYQPPVFHRAKGGELVCIYHRPDLSGLGGSALTSPAVDYPNVNNEHKALSTIDSGRTWSDWGRISGFPVECTSGVFRIGDELIHIGYGEGWQLFLRRSVDDDGTWSDRQLIPRDVISEQRPGLCGPFVMNDRIMVTSQGRIVIPVDYLLGAEGPDPDLIGTVVSADGGRTWVRSPLFGPPEAFPDRPEGFGEPAVVELSDGRLWMVFRSCLGHLWQAFSNDGGETWGPPTSTCLESAISPCNAKRIPGTDSVLIVWDNARYGSFPNPYRPRSPLVMAVSHDCCKTWSKPVVIEESGTCAYPSICFTNDEVFIFYMWRVDSDPRGRGIHLSIYDTNKLISLEYGEDEE